MVREPSIKESSLPIYSLVILVIEHKVRTRNQLKWNNNSSFSLYICEAKPGKRKKDHLDKNKNERRETREN